MSDLIRFQPAKARRRSASGDRGAQILFFTGVRYERMSEDARSPAPPTSCIARRRGDGEGVGGGDRGRRR
jgi:hypothetical protein